MAVQIQLRRDTASNWTTNNPTLAQGEFAIETDTDKYKIGDGSTAWTSLGYSSLPAGTATIASPTFTGVPAGPTASANTSTTQLATTAFVMTELGDYALLADPTFTGNVTIQTLDMDTIVEGDVIYGSGADTLARLAKGSDDEVLTLASGVPSWAAPASSSPILGYKVDTSNGNYSTTSTSFVDVHTTNARVAITTPSGCTAIAALLAAYGGNTGGSTTWQANTSAGTNYDIRLQDNSYWTIGGLTALTVITGLTASTAYNIDWQFKCSAGTTNIYGDSVRPRMVVVAL